MDFPLNHPMSEPSPSARHPLTWVPSLYLAMGLPNVTVGVVAAIIYKNLGVSNEEIALYTSQMYLPWVLKPLWSPFLEPFMTKRRWVITMEFAMMAALGAVAFCLPLDGFFRASLAFFWIVGFASATQDIVADGVFMTTMPVRDQARYAGLQGMCWNMGAVIASGLLVSLTGWLHNGLGYSWVKCWVLVMAGTGLVMGGFGLWHLRVLPTGQISPLHGQGARDPNPEDVSVRTFGAQFVEVEVDMATGEVTVLRVVTAHDVGRIVNPTLVDSQVIGGITQGVGFGVSEGRIMDDRLGLVMNGNLEDYYVPTIADVPEIEHIPVDVPDVKANSTGAKGVGEPPLIPTAPAIANAIFDATGIRVRANPITRDSILSAGAHEQRAIR